MMQPNKTSRTEKDENVGNVHTEAEDLCDICAGHVLGTCRKPCQAYEAITAGTKTVEEVKDEFDRQMQTKAEALAEQLFQQLNETGILDRISQEAREIYAEAKRAKEAQERMIV